MANKIETELIVEAIAKGFKNVQKDLGKVADANKKLAKSAEGLNKAGKKQEGIFKRIGGSWKEIVGVGAVVGGTLLAIKKGFDFAAEGAQLQKVADTFDTLTVSIGSTSSAMLNTLREASAGMVADSELMASANQLVSMGLASTESEAAKLTKTAVALGSAMGKNATQSMEEFSLLLANQSIPRLDTFGISAGKVRARINELKAANKGMSRETAFMTATMEEAEKSMDRLGGEVPVDEFTAFSVQVKNLTDTAKKAVAKGLGPLVGAMNDFLEAGERSRAVGKAFKEDVAEGFEEAAKQTKEYADELDRLQKIHPQFLGGLTAQERALRNTWDAQEAVNQGIENISRNYQLLGESLGVVIPTTIRASDATAELGDKTMQTDAQLSEYDAHLRQVASGADAVGAAAEDSWPKLLAFGLGLRGLTPPDLSGTASDIWDIYNAAVAAERALNPFDDALRGINQAQDEAEDRAAELETAVDIYDGMAEKVDAADTALFNMAEEARRSPEALALMENEGIPHITAVQTAVELATGKFELAKDEANLLKAAIDLWPTQVEIDVIFNISSTGQPPPGSNWPGAGPARTPPGGSSGGSGPDAEGATGISDFKVPPGFPNDSFRVGVTSGEVVNVQTQGQQKGGGGHTFIFQMPDNVTSPRAFAKQAVGQIADELGARG